MQLALVAQGRPVWALSRHKGAEKLSQTQGPPSSAVGQEQPQGTLAGHGLASGDPASDWLVQEAAPMRATVRATRVLRWPSTAEAYQRQGRMLPRTPPEAKPSPPTVAPAFPSDLAAPPGASRLALGQIRRLALRVDALAARHAAPLASVTMVLVTTVGG